MSDNGSFTFVDTLVFKFCSENFRESEFMDRYCDLYNVVEFFMRRAGLDDNTFMPGLIVFKIIHDYLNGCVPEANDTQGVDNYRDALITEAFSNMPQ